MLPITLGEALSGGTVRAETIDGAVDVKIPKGANTGTTMRLRGKGVADQKGGTRGDHMLELRVTLPEAPDPELEASSPNGRASTPMIPRTKGGRT